MTEKAFIHDHLRSRAWRGAVFAVRYPGRASDPLPDGIHPFIQLEVGSARVTPGEERSISSWVHDHLAEEASEVAVGLVENRPPAVHCVRPEVTLLEKVEAIHRRFSRDPFEPAGFIRHYEDVARILTSGAIPSNEELRQLLAEMATEGDIREWPAPNDPALDPEVDPIRWDVLEAAWRALGPMFWGERISLPACAKELRDFVQALSIE